MRERERGRNFYKRDIERNQKGYREKERDTERREINRDGQREGK